jgi:uncharacterized protein YggT (Ycf19 family)
MSPGTDNTSLLGVTSNHKKARAKSKVFTMMKFFAAVVVVGSILSCLASASVFVPQSSTRGIHNGMISKRSSATNDRNARHRLRLAARMAATASPTIGSSRGSGSGGEIAMAIPGYGVAEQVFVGGFSNFLGIYNLVITARILLSWFPQAQSVGVLQPVYAITDPYLNLFRGILPPIFGLDFSPILAFLLLNFLTSVRFGLLV